MLIELTIMHDVFRSMVLLDGHRNLSVLFSLIDKIMCQFCLKLSRHFIRQIYMIYMKNPSLFFINILFKN